MLPSTERVNTQTKHRKHTKPTPQHSRIKHFFYRVPDWSINTSFPDVTNQRGDKHSPYTASASTRLTTAIHGSGVLFLLLRRAAGPCDERRDSRELERVGLMAGEGVRGSDGDEGTAG
ncbi:hypothetical protein E2C01_064341 [Portunus trituberculatus]|uniref:Uncharacterized protein n=1 Tax=Portunus trituberculatus TaxID=210409 RepID=A0A5B7HIT1_PORTR|nr:hypothetical protein [Portunus trituberculatus]